MPSITLTKCQGTGNDFVLLDNRAGGRFPYAALARNACDRRFGIGADGLLVLLPAAPSTDADVALRIFNADGSEAESCGNGIRCVARYLAREEGKERAFAIGTPAGLAHTEPAGLPGTVRVDMGVPELSQPLGHKLTFRGRTLNFASISMGNPHAVVFVDDDPDAYELDELANALAAAQRESGVNVELARAVSGRIQMRVHERGVGETWACGTGACAAAVAAIASGRLASPVEVATRGGSVHVSWGGPQTPAVLTGSAEIVFDTTLELSADLLASA